MGITLNRERECHSNGNIAAACSSSVVRHICFFSVITKCIIQSAHFTPEQWHGMHQCDSIPVHLCLAGGHSVHSRRGSCVLGGSQCVVHCYARWCNGGMHCYAQWCNGDLQCYALWYSGGMQWIHCGAMVDCTVHQLCYMCTLMHSLGALCLAFEFPEPQESNTLLCALTSAMLESNCGLSLTLSVCQIFPNSGGATPIDQILYEFWVHHYHGHHSLRQILWINLYTGFIIIITSFRQTLFNTLCTG